MQNTFKNKKWIVTTILYAKDRGVGETNLRKASQKQVCPKERLW